MKKQKKIIVTSVVAFGAILVLVGMGLLKGSVSSGTEGAEAVSAESTLPGDAISDSTAAESASETAPDDSQEEQLLSWEIGSIQGQAGINPYVEYWLQSDRVYLPEGTQPEYLTFVHAESKAAYVIAGVREKDILTGSVWYVPLGEEGPVTLVRQQISLRGEEAAYLSADGSDYLVLQYAEAGKENGGIWSFDGEKEILDNIPGIKEVSPDRMIQCRMGEETYTFTYLENGKVKAVDNHAPEKEQLDLWFAEMRDAWDVAQEAGDWQAPDIVNDSFVYGETYEPSETEKAVLQGAVADYSRDWESRPRDMYEVTDAAFTEYAGQIYLLGRTEQFRAFGNEITGRMLIGTPDGAYVLVDKPFTSNYGVQPRMAEADFDGDGSAELAIAGLTEHGTGVCVEFLYMVDNSGENQWYCYRLGYEWYEEHLMSHVDTRHSEQGAELVFDGEGQGYFLYDYGDPEMEYDAGRQISFEVSTDRMMCYAVLIVSSPEHFVGIGDGSRLEMEIGYAGDGKWTEKACQVTVDAFAREQTEQWAQNLLAETNAKSR